VEIQEQLLLTIPRNAAFISLIYFFIASTSSEQGEKRIFCPSIFYLLLFLCFVHLCFSLKKKNIVENVTAPLGGKQRV